MIDQPSEPLPEDPLPEEVERLKAEPRFRYQLWDMLALIAAIACFMSTIRAIGWVSVALLPAFLIAPSVLTHPENSRGVKLGFIIAMLFLTVILYFRTG